MNIPVPHMEQIFARYLRQKFVGPIHETPTLFYGVMYGLIQPERGRDHPIITSSIVLKPLSKISDEHAIGVCKIIHGNFKKEVAIELGREFCRDLLLYAVFKECYADDLIIAHQYLQYLGYALQQTVFENGQPITYTVDQLVEAGVFRINNE